MGGTGSRITITLLAPSVQDSHLFHAMNWTIVKLNLLPWLTAYFDHYLCNYNLGLADSASSSCAYISVISFAKYAFACGLLTYKSTEMKCQHSCISIHSNRIDGPTLNVGVRRPFSSVNGSATRVTALTNSKPLSWYNNKYTNIMRNHSITSRIENVSYGECAATVKRETCASFPIESMSASTAALALGSEQSCLKSSYYRLARTN